MPSTLAGGPASPPPLLELLLPELLLLLPELLPELLLLELDAPPLLELLPIAPLLPEAPLLELLVPPPLPDPEPAPLDELLLLDDVSPLDEPLPEELLPDPEPPPELLLPPGGTTGPPPDVEQLRATPPTMPAKGIAIEVARRSRFMKSSARKSLSRDCKVSDSSANARRNCAPSSAPRPRVDPI
jgi:hypothetical protein